MSFFTDILSEAQRVVAPPAGAIHPESQTAEFEVDFDPTHQPIPAMESHEADRGAQPISTSIPSAPMSRITTDPMATTDRTVVLERHIDTVQSSQPPLSPAVGTPKPTHAGTPNARTSLEQHELHEIQAVLRQREVPQVQNAFPQPEAQKVQTTLAPHAVPKIRSSFLQHEEQQFQTTLAPHAVPKIRSSFLQHEEQQHAQTARPLHEVHEIQTRTEQREVSLLVKQANPFAVPDVHEVSAVPIAETRAQATIEPPPAETLTNPSQSEKEAVASSTRLSEGSRVHIGRVEVVIVQSTPPPVLNSSFTTASPSSLLSRRYLRSL